MNFAEVKFDFLQDPIQRTSRSNVSGHFRGGIGGNDLQHLDIDSFAQFSAISWRKLILALLILSRIFLRRSCTFVPARDGVFQAPSTFC